MQTGIVGAAARIGYYDLLIGAYTFTSGFYDDQAVGDLSPRRIKSEYINYLLSSFVNGVTDIRTIGNVQIPNVTQLRMTVTATGLTFVMTWSVSQYRATNFTFADYLEARVGQTIELLIEPL